ncbi:unnamed protein product [Gongylonema pulchrum]|uniref:Cytochrome c oxidase subunit 1 n=1 Tax=Gongylonema pulchrum TaxID=637853 RepID=A0A183DAA9_9BILA|nr:unnamed protein product [Gongylonema pulchrum]
MNIFCGLLYKHNSFKQNIFNTVNHKSIAGLGGSIFSVFMRVELSCPGGFLLSGSGQIYNSILTIHGILMIFFIVIPILIGGFGN